MTSYAKASHKSVVLSIHQPRAEMFKLLSESDGQIVLLSRGDVVYSGPVRQILPWFESAGLDPCPVDMNPFDYILDRCMVDFTSASTEETSKAQRDHLTKAWRERMRGTAERERESGTPISLMYTLQGRSSTSNSFASRQGKMVQESENYVDDMVKERGAQDNSLILDDMDPLESSSAKNDHKDRLSVWQQTVILTRRGWINQRRDSVFFWGVLAINILLGVLIGSIFWKLGGSLNDIRARSSVCYVLMAFQPFLSMIIAIYRGATDMEIYERERGYRWYGPLPFLISNSLCNMPTNVINPASESLKKEVHRVLLRF